ncbi:phosphoadenylyl-sulfate reductase [Ferrimonas gelatinilytica]|uniref:Phosphoadenosine 5'-phosphosulfate reductase n=1 Tax=Ferrimonas gelatinilytica TaxID=1255257 RepID=A0ABP9S718_9GAMM
MTSSLSQGSAALAALLEKSPQRQEKALARLNRELEGVSAEERIAWGLAQLPGNHGLSSSFGIQAAVMLSLVTEQAPGIPVILTDTGYLFAETYRFIDTLTERLDLNLKIYRSDLSSAWQQARYGKEWEQGQEALDRYNRRNKVLPMQRALKELEIGSWFAGLRREQAKSRAALPLLAIRSGRYKLLPILDWSNKQVHDYLQAKGLPYHPLWEQGYVSVGDSHSSRPLELGMSEEETRFAGLKRECGLHYEI